MNKSLKLALAGILLIASTAAAHAEGVKDAVRDQNGKPVRSTNGECVRTKWEGSADPCAVAKPPVAPVIPPIAREDRTVYFAFNKATLTKEAKERLTTLAAQMKARGAIKAVHIAGYADRMGNAAYNEKLSKRRADAVRDFLMKQGIANANTVETRWFGDSVAAAKCPKNLKRQDKIVCMQPDRRVEVEVEFETPVAK